MIGFSISRIIAPRSGLNTLGGTSLCRDSGPLSSQLSKLPLVHHPDGLGSQVPDDTESFNKQREWGWEERTSKRTSSEATHLVY